MQGSWFRVQGLGFRLGGKSSFGVRSSVVDVGGAAECRSLVSTWFRIVKY